MQAVDAHKTTPKGFGKNILLRNTKIFKCKKTKACHKVIETSRKVLVQRKKKARLTVKGEYSVQCALI